jgi:hypothetical protein
MGAVTLGSPRQSILKDRPGGGPRKIDDRWFESIRERPATVRAYEKAAAVNTQNLMTEEAKRVLFGQSARPEQIAR